MVIDLIGTTSCDERLIQFEVPEVLYGSFHFERGSHANNLKKTLDK